MLLACIGRIDSVLYMQYTKDQGKIGGGMFKAVIPVMLVASLAGCGATRSDALSYSADVDAEKGLAVFTCKTSTTDRCIFRFDGNAQPDSLTVPKGEAAGVTGVSPGGAYCATTGAPGASCQGQILHAGVQAIHHEKRISR
jgi:hypothetical protein